MALTPRTEQVISTLTVGELAGLDAVADEQQVSRAEVIRRGIFKEVAAHRRLKAKVSSSGR